MTRQEAYERIRAHFVADRRFGYDPTLKRDVDPLTPGGCVYIGGEGQRCAVGCLLPADSPMGDFQGGVFSLSESYADEFEAVFGDAEINTPLVRFLASAQSIHDGIAMRADGTIEHFISELDALAFAEGLTVVGH
jgi:hypothetical protein